MSLKQKYKETLRHEIKEKLGLQNIMQVPRLQKIVLNMGVGDATANRKLLDEAAETLSLITGQKATITKAKKAISNFKLREGMGIGAKVTLHGNIMWEFLDRLVNISLPRVRDFRGIPRRGFDGAGNYTLGIKEQTIFVEIDYDKISKPLGMDITFATTAKNDDEGRALMEALGLPFRK